jgi:hypothetical protein
MKLLLNILLLVLLDAILVSIATILSYHKLNGF